MVRLETKRCIISALQPTDAPFIFNLLNSPGWLQYIGDRGINNFDDAHNYILNGPVKSYFENGFGLYLVQEKASGEKIGLCGLLKRDQFQEPDLGFAFLPEYTGKGFGGESAKAVLQYTMEKSSWQKVLAITSADNLPSIHLLENLGFTFEKMIPWPNEEDLKLFALKLKNDASE
jgi:[ribosomal protein S5]-alanine N-acetyltransferase